MYNNKVSLKALDIFGELVKDQFAHLVYLNICIITNLRKFGLNWSSKFATE